MFTADTRAIEHLLTYVVDQGATDLHVGAGEVPRVRIDGRLVVVPGVAPLDASQMEDVTDGLLRTDAQHRFRDHHQVDFSFTFQSAHRFRGNAYLRLGAPALALRLIPAAPPSMEALGLPAVCTGLIGRPHGLVLVTGPTGSGKSTTLAAMIAEIARTRPGHVLTLEDPIEYVHQSSTALVSQREIGADAPSFAAGLRAALREDPDVVLVGEMRDAESIALTLTLAETGHLVFATLHTNEAASAVDRIVDVFPDGRHDQIRTQLAGSLAAVISQRLVPRADGPGRIAAFEVMAGTPAVLNLIREGRSRQLRNAIATGREHGMFLLEQHLAHLVADGHITLDAARAVSVHPDEIVNSPTGGRR